MEHDARPDVEYTQYSSSVNCRTVAADRIAQHRIIDKRDAGLHWYVKHASVRTA